MSSSSSAKSPSSSSSPKTTGIQQQHDYVPFMNEQYLPIIDYSNEVICEKILLDESEELYDKMVEDLTNKTINDTASNSELSSLSLLPRKEISGAQNGDTQRLAAYTYREEEHTFIHSEIDNKDRDNQING